MIEDISSVGIVEKSGESQTKASVDRILGISEDGDSELCLCEFKARVKQLEAQKEQDRIHLLRGNDLMGEDDIFVEMNAEILCRTWELPNLTSASKYTMHTLTR